MSPPQAAPDPWPDVRQPGQAAPPSPQPVEPRADEPADDPADDPGDGPAPAAWPPPPPTSAERSAAVPGRDPEPSPAPSLQGGAGADSRPVRPRRAPSTADFTEEAMLRGRQVRPESGWRHWLYRLTGGLVNLGLSPAEQRRRDMGSRVKNPITGSRRIVVLSRKGGVGKTTTTLMLGHTFATWRGDRCIALDGNPDAGSIAYRIRRETTETVTSLLADRDRIDRYSDVRAYTSQTDSRLEVIASDDDPRITQALDEHDYEAAITLLDYHYNLILLDTGTGILDSATQGILRQADQIVVVVAPSLDGARVAAMTLDWLEEHGYNDLVTGAVAVINGVRDRGLVEIGRVEEHFTERCRAVVRVPWDQHLEAGAGSSLEDLQEPTRAGYLDLAAAVADGFGTHERRS